jgi:hypothetical protein
MTKLYEVKFFLPNDDEVMTTKVEFEVLEEMFNNPAYELVDYKEAWDESN